MSIEFYLKNIFYYLNMGVMGPQLETNKEGNIIIIIIIKKERKRRRQNHGNSRG